MATPRKPWPPGAEQQRLDTVSAIEEARRLLRAGRKTLRDSQAQLKVNPELKEKMDLKTDRDLADVDTLLADALRWLGEAKQMG